MRRVYRLLVSVALGAEHVHIETVHCNQLQLLYIFITYTYTHTHVQRERDTHTHNEDLNWRHALMRVQTIYCHIRTVLNLTLHTQKGGKKEGYHCTSTDFREFFSHLFRGSSDDLFRNDLPLPLPLDPYPHSSPQ